MSLTLPAAFAARMRAIVDDYPAFEHALCEQDAAKALYATNKIAPDALRAALPFALTPLPFTDRGFAFDAPNPGRHPLHHAGGFYVQDASAQATVACAPVRTGMRVLDCCAAPGGKSIALGCAVGDTGLLVANEVNPTRVRTLASNIERTGLKNTLVTSVDTATLPTWYDGYFDLVLADAPCSGEGMFRKYPAALEGWNEGMVRKCANLQHTILADVAPCVAPGGYLLYSTCTFSPEEDEQTVEAFLDTHADFALVPVPDNVQRVTAPGLTERTRDARRFYPHLFPGEGQFIALIRRSPDAPCGKGTTVQDASVPPTRDELAALGTFFKENTTLDPTRAAVRRCRDGLRLLSCDTPLPPRGVFACGVLLGSLEKSVFRPHHQFFSAYGAQFARTLELAPDFDAVAQYLRGQTLSTTLTDGWCALTTAGAPLGGGKAVAGTLKNHYPKGLRQM